MASSQLNVLLEYLLGLWLLLWRAANDNETTANMDRTPPAEWRLLHKEDFSCAVDVPQTLDGSVWEIQTGDGTEFGLPPGWGNNEPQIYTDMLDNVAVVSDADAENGCALRLAALKDESEPDATYTSARVRARPDSPLGALVPSEDAPALRIAARLKLPAGAPENSGVWPAFWMLPTDTVYGGWAASGEIDIVEGKHTMQEAGFALHFGGEWPRNTYVNGAFRREQPFSDGYHEFAVEWHRDRFVWLVDGESRYEVTKDQWFSSAAPDDDRAPFDAPFHVLLNLAVGGTYAGQPTPETPFPQHLSVDYITVHALDN